jgi:hypothetical protein
VGYMMILGECCGCGRLFTFNPNWVPSIRDKRGERQPVCADCMGRRNAKRIADGLEPDYIHPDAYEAEDVGY